MSAQIIEIVVYRSLKGGFVKHLSQAAQKTVTQFVAMTVINLVIPKAKARQELWFNKYASSTLVKFFWKCL